VKSTTARKANLTSRKAALSTREVIIRLLHNHVLVRTRLTVRYPSWQFRWTILQWLPSIDVNGCVAIKTRMEKLGFFVVKQNLPGGGSLVLCDNYSYICRVIKLQTATFNVNRHKLRSFSREVCFGFNFWVGIFSTIQKNVTSQPTFQYRIKLYRWADANEIVNRILDTVVTPNTKWMTSINVVCDAYRYSYVLFPLIGYNR
jgi:hypothetical protein